MVAINHGAEVIVSRLGGGGLNVIDTKTRKVSVIDPASLPETPDPQYPCPDLKTSGAFISHGLSVKHEANGHDRLFVVRHGGREAIEIFQFSRPGDVGSLAWLGCVRLPKGFAGNAVTGRRDGGFYVTSMTDEGDAPGSSKLAKLYAGRPSGVVLEWTPGGGYHRVPTGAMSGPNGIELSPDDRWLYVNGWASHEIVRYDLDHPHAPARRLHVSFMPDNLRWAGDGSLIAAGIRQSTPKAVFECAGTHADGKPCAVRWTVVSIDPVSMTLKAELRQQDHSGFGDVSVALPIGRTLWLGDFDGHSILIEPDKLLTKSNR
ncbi:MAG: SMP-30/gluconolactonase/LRE family protein [Gammaproteobacteria bacterium]